MGHEESKNMAKSVNKVILLGNVGKDPEIRSTPGGTMVANFSLATSDRFQDAAGQLAGPHRVAQSGRFQAHRRDRPRLCEEGLQALHRRQDPDPQLGRQGYRAKRYKTEIIVNDLSLLSGREEQGGGGYSRSSSAIRRSERYGPARARSRGRVFAQSAEISDDDIPF